MAIINLGNLANAINAQAVILEYDDAIDQGEIITIHEIKRRKTHAINRTNTRAGPIDTYPWSIIEVDFVAVLTKDIQNHFETLNTLNPRSALPTENFTLTGLALSGAAENITVGPFTATIPDFESDAGETGEFTARIKLRIIEAVPT